MAKPLVSNLLCAVEHTAVQALAVQRWQRVIVFLLHAHVWQASITAAMPKHDSLPLLYMNEYTWQHQ